MIVTSSRSIHSQTIIIESCENIDHLGRKYLSWNDINPQNNLLLCLIKSFYVRSNDFGLCIQLYYNPLLNATIYLCIHVEFF